MTASRLAVTVVRDKTPSIDAARRLARWELTIALTIAAAVVAGLATHSQAKASISAVEARHHVGKEAKVCGVVASTRYDSEAQGRPTFLNLDKPYPQQVFTIVIWGKDRLAFGAPEEKYRAKRVCVTGVIEAYRGTPQIPATHPTQIDVLTVSDSQELTVGRSNGLSDAEIRRTLIQESIARYPGSCPCPYFRDRAGRRCGGRSAYSRPGGSSPLCYDRDVTDKMIQNYRNTHQ